MCCGADGRCVGEEVVDVGAEEREEAEVDNGQRCKFLGVSGENGEVRLQIIVVFPVGHYSQRIV